MAGAMERSVIYLTTPTSATASMWRIFAILRGTEQPWWWTQPFWAEGRQEELRTAVPPTDGAFIMMNYPDYLNPSLNLADYRFILNMRDPRDVLCNQYHWAQQHEEPDRKGEALEAHRARIVAMGIDAYVLIPRPTDASRAFRRVREGADPADVLVLTYALLCARFDLFVEKACRFLGVRELNADQRARLEAERVEKLGSNKDWIGQRWSGSDIMPGRYRRELRPETIAVLNERYGETIRFIRDIDDPSVRELYEI